jgi:hypothetical protein
MKAETENKILNCNSISEYLKVLQAEFKTKDCKPGKLAKATLIYNLHSKVKNAGLTVNDEFRSQVLNSEHLDEFINIVLNHYKLFDTLGTQGKQELINSTKQIMALTGLKEN